MKIIIIILFTIFGIMGCSSNHNFEEQFQRDKEIIDFYKKQQVLMAKRYQLNINRLETMFMDATSADIKSRQMFYETKMQPFMIIKIDSIPFPAIK